MTDGKTGVRVLWLPLKTSPGGNNREHHMVRSRRVKKEREAVRWFLNGQRAGDLPVTIKLTRIGPVGRLLDDDNLPMALKPVRDEIAAWIGADDADPRITWRYAQRREKKWWVYLEFAWHSGTIATSA